ncbi:hypermethylated in cancer 2 protein [Centroberyx affinis]|uniref:hypermethylated in cancer 2 protein n=1 Tax=Centroberyx affinis TaxID=166261 RepID=UPI003A5BC3DE
MEQPNYAKQLLMQLNQQRSKGYLCDVIIVVESALFRAHKNILAASSSYFKSLVLHDNLINLDTEMVKPSVFRQVLDFIYTGQLPHSDHISDPGVSALLTAASYLQLSDLAALCRRRLKLSSSSKTPSSTTSSLTPNGHLFRPHRLSCAPLRVSHNYRSVSVEVGRSQKEDLSEEELFIARCVSLNPPPGVKIDNGVEMGLGLRLELPSKSPTGSMATEEVRPSSLHSTSNSASPDDLPSNSTSVFCNPRPVQGEDQQHLKTAAESQQKARKRPRPGSEGSLERMASVQGKRQVASGERVHGEERASSELEDQEEVREGEAALENDLENSEESVQSESEEEEPRENKHAGYMYYQPQPGFEPALGDNLYVCIPCRKGFPSSEQLNAHVDSHTAEEFSVKARDAEEGSSVKDEDRDADPENLPSQSAKEEAKSDQLLPCHICSVCSKSYVDAALLRQHEKSHWLTRPFPCSICGKLFTQRGTMTRHMRSHLGLKPFACEECGMRFTRQYRLTEHMCVHSGEKPYECRLCGGKFAQQRNLISHLRMHASPS